MKASKLIETLASLISKNGDFPVVLDDTAEELLPEVSEVNVCVDMNGEDVILISPNLN